MISIRLVLFGVLVSGFSGIYGQLYDCPTTPIDNNARAAVVLEHNRLRSSLANGNEKMLNDTVNVPPAKNMYKLDYDCTLESYAQSWADRCIYPGHSPPSHRNGTGENMMMDIATMSPTDALVEATRLWWDEIRTCGLVIGSTTTYDDYNTSCVRGHFTQCTWARTTLIGCGVRFCENGTFYGVNKPGLVVVCNYKEAGNVIGQPITQIGNPCQTDSECTTFPGSTCDASMGLCQVPGYTDMTTVQTITTTPLPGSCYDKEEHNCPYYRWQGYCNTSSIYYPWCAGMCAKTCGVCTDATTTTPAATTPLVTTPAVTTPPATTSAVTTPEVTPATTPTAATTLAATTSEVTTPATTPPSATTLAATTPVVTTPPAATTPEITTPSTTPSAATTPAATTPEVTTPATTPLAATTPVATTPEVTPPAATTPEITTPATTPLAATTPAASTPKVTTPPPAATTPEITTPATTPPAATTPAASTPKVTTPATTPPAATTPAVTTPEVATPPAATTPKITTPATTPPAATTPAASTPKVTTPATTPPVANTPAVTTPEVTTPSAATTPAVTTQSQSTTTTTQRATTTSASGCITRDTLITGNPNDTLLVQSIYNSKDLYNTTNYCGLQWGATPWTIFKGSYLKNITATLGSSMTLTDKHQMVLNVISIFLKSYVSNTWFYCIRIGTWGSMAEYLNCADNGGRVCQCQTTTTSTNPTTIHTTI